MKRMAKFIINVGYGMAVFPIYSAFSGKMGVSAFFPWYNGWRLFTRGKFISVKEPRLWVLEYYRHFIPKSGGVVFDVGGELGYETKQFSRLVGPGGKVFVFECLPSHVEKLQEIAKESGNIAVVERACWNSECDLEFFVGLTPGSNTAVPDAKGQHGQRLAATEKTVKVKAETLDNLWSRLCGDMQVDFLKMDIEGAEYEALEGAAVMLKNTKRAVIAAYHIRDGVPTAPRVKELLLSSGFYVRVDENNHVYAWRV